MLPRTMVKAMVQPTRAKMPERMILLRRVVRTFQRIEMGKQITFLFSSCQSNTLLYLLQS